MSALWFSWDTGYLARLNLVSTDTAATTAVTALQHAAQDYIERYCHRVFAQQEFDLVVPIEQEGSCILPNPPVDHVSHLLAPSGQWASITNTSTSVTQASFSTSKTALYLSRIVVGVRTDTPLTLATYPSLTQLQTAIDAVGNGWQFTINTNQVGVNGNYPSSYLVANQYGTCANQTSTYLFFWEESVTRNFHVNSGSGIIEGYGGVSWNQQYPVIWGSGLIRYNPVRVIYTAGFASVPEPIKLVCANLVISAYQSPEGRAKAETLGGYSYTLFDPAQIPMSDQKILALYKDWRV